MIITFNGQRRFSLELHFVKYKMIFYQLNRNMVQCGDFYCSFCGYGLATFVKKERKHSFRPS